MGFPSPAADYVEPRLTVDALCQMDTNCRIVETDTGYAVIDLSSWLEKEKPFSPHSTIERSSLNGWGALITEYGEAIEGEALEGVTVHGLLTYTINRVYDDIITPV